MNYLHLIAVAIILTLFFIFLFLDFKRKRSNPNFPTLLITLGIAFTFLGIALGLRNFNISNIDESLPHLIDGIKTAFWGSVTGIFSAIFLKIIGIICFKEEDKIEIEIQKFYKEHSSLLQGQDKTNRHLEIQNNLMNNVIQHLQLITQDNTNQQINVNLTNLLILLKVNDQNQKKSHFQLNELLTHSLNSLIRNQIDSKNDIILKLEDIKTQLASYSDQQLQSNSYVFTTAIEKAMTHLNEQILQNLGSNFQDLDQSIENLVVWQGNYLQHIQEHDQIQKNVIQQFSHIQEDFQKIITHSQKFSLITSEINEMFNNIENQQSHVESRMQYFYKTLDEKFIDFDKSKLMIENGFNAASLLLEKFKTEMDYVYQDTRHYLQSNQKQNLDFLIKANEELSISQKNMNQNFKQTYQNLNKDLDLLKQKHEIALNDSLMTLAQQLGSISEKFAYDYEPITKNLKNMMQALNDGVNKETALHLAEKTATNDEILVK